MRRIIAQAAAVLPVTVLGGLIALAGPARAATVATVTLSVDTTKVNCAGGQCDYNVNCSVTVTNLSATDLSVPFTPPVSVLPSSVTWSAPNGDSGTVNGEGTGVAWPGAANGYTIVPPGASVTTTGCNTSPIITQEATSADLTVSVQVYPGDYPGLGPAQTISATATFLPGGTPLPVGLAVAGPVVAAGAGVTLLTLQRSRSRRRKHKH